MKRRGNGSRQNHRNRDRTRNFKAYRLVVRWPGQHERHVTVDTKKILRTIRDDYLTNGAAVEEQEHAGWGAYRTMKVHPAVPRRSTEKR